MPKHQSIIFKMRDLSIYSLSPTRRFLSAVLLLIGISGCDGGGGGVFPPPVNQAPVASNSCDYASGVNQLFNGTLSATDPEGQSLSYSLVSDGSKGNVSINAFSGAFIYTPFMNSRGTDTFTFRACEPAPSTLCSNVATYKVAHTPRIMPLGDSITQGVTSSNTPPDAQRIGYRKPLLDSLSNAGYQIDFVGTLGNGTGATPPLTDPEHDGHGGCTADEFLTGVDGVNCLGGTGNLTNWLNTAKPDVVLLHIGTNDISNAMGFNSNDVNDVAVILNTIDTWEATNWPVTVIVPRIITHQDYPNATTSFNNAVMTMVGTRTTDTLEWVDQQLNVSFPGDYGDNVHPNTSGYQKMANVWLWPLTGDNTISTVSGNHSGAGILPKCP